MEGKAVVLYKAFLLEPLHIVPYAVLVIFLIIVGLDRVQQIEVKISRAGPLQTDPELSLAFFLIRGHEKRVDLGGQRETVSGIAVHKGLFGCFLGSAVLSVDESRVKISEPRFHEHIYHCLGLFDIDPVRLAGHCGKAHQSKSQFGGVQ